MPELPDNPVPKQPQLPPLPSLAPLRRAAQEPIIQGFQAINSVEVIDLTGLSVDEDEDEGEGDGEWEDVPEVIDLTNLPSDSENDDNAEAEAQDGPVQNYTILNLPSRSRYALVDHPPITAPRHPRRLLRPAVRTLPKVATHASAAAARVPVRRDVCELCARVVRWGPGCLITKHHLYPQEITRKYAHRYTQAQKNSLALLCRPCHDACHRIHNNRTLAEFYYEVNLLRADPAIQEHIRLMQRATTPELIRMHGDGVSVLRGKKYLKRLARAAARAEKEREATGRPQPTQADLRAMKAPNSPLLRRSARLTGTTLRIQEPTPLRGSRRSARLLAKSMGDQHEVPVIVIDDDEDEAIPDSATRGNTMGKENEKALNPATVGELLDLAARGEYIAL
ncbi:hypothetical protein DHEL01_v211972 [Diaporthe helianthi]|uniref:HNH domain-containing protein n=1 Tax=Diaporthe helianthi TaxID=158607 RepID=A0A2P5HHA3_DIAHE|nr:hypothetical protein DHEL01_v211972 [Diaporthe helianthi]